MCFFSRSGYRPFINPPPSLGNLLLDITLMFNFIPVSSNSLDKKVSFCFLVNFTVYTLQLGLGFRVRVRDR